MNTVFVVAAAVFFAVRLGVFLYRLRERGQRR